ELYAGGELPAELERRLGPGLLADDGAVDRAALANLVFRDSSVRRELESIVHPAVRATILGRLDVWRAEPFDGFAVIDAALLVEADSPYPLDALVVVTAGVETRIERLRGRGVPEADARRRIAAQASDEEKIARADYVVRNDGDLEALERAVARLAEDLERHASGRARGPETG
ncbi:MAG: dephospho-CoA kinase, partial [Gemmatimonadetes bacterium]|nr:dephospho-CoA kinase [Gemmatimonadota bacterium]